MSEIAAYSRATLGAVQGFSRYYVRPELTAKRGWLAIGLGVLAYELACPKGELLSEGVDRALEKQKLLTIGAVAITSAHLLNLLPEQVDPFSQFIKHIKSSRD